MSRRVLFDTNFLSWFCDNQSPVPFIQDDAHDTLTDRFDYLLDRLTADGSEVVIPTPVLAEVMCATSINTAPVLNLISQNPYFRLPPFGQRAAEEFGMLFRGQHRGSDNRNSFKFDLLILAIAKTESIDVIYSSDAPLRQRAATLGIRCLSFQDLPKRPTPPQTAMQFPVPPSKTLQ